MKRHIVIILLALISVVTLGGCAGPNGQRLTEQEIQAKIVKNETTIRISVRTATKAILLTLDDKDVAESAPYIYKVALAINQGTQEGVITLPQLRALSNQLLSSSNATEIKRRTASDLIAIGITFIEGVLESQYANASEADKVKTTQVLVRAASAGVAEAMVDFFPSLPASTQPSP